MRYSDDRPAASGTQNPQIHGGDAFACRPRCRPETNAGSVPHPATSGSRAAARVIRMSSRSDSPHRGLIATAVCRQTPDRLTYSFSEVRWLQARRMFRLRVDGARDASTGVAAVFPPGHVHCQEIRQGLEHLRRLPKPNVKKVALLRGPARPG